MTRQTTSASPSKELLAAQEKLMALRARLAEPKKQSFSLFRTADHQPLSVEQAFNLFQAAQQDDSAQQGRAPEPDQNDHDYEYDHDKDQDQLAEREVTLHPSIGLGMLRCKQESSGRLWLLLRHLDQEGRGWIDLSTARQAITADESPLKICGPRHLRGLIARGEGIFWHKNEDRLWLRSVSRVGASLGVSRLQGRPVALPLKTLTQSMGHVRAHLYAAFHSGRKTKQPISRASLSRISQVSPRSQRNYEKRARVRKQKNYAAGPRLNSDQAQEQAWQKGPACFPWQDKKGNLGQKNAVYLAWQLPNSYEGPHEKRPNGNRKRFNRQLADLSNKGMMGNGRAEVECRGKRYWANAKAAIQHAAGGQSAAYWPGERRGIWYTTGMDQDNG